jgi:hypothetical protein
MRLGSILRLFSLLAALGVAAPSFAGDVKTLIEMNGGKPTPGLAKSWKSAGAGTYEFTLDTSKEIKKGTPVDAASVKSSLEGKLGSAYGVKVAPKGADGVTVTYTGDEQKFLEQVAKTKIRAGDVELALESSVSEGGIRAKVATRKAEAGEVKGVVTKIAGNVITAKITESKTDKIKTGETVKVNGTVKGLKANDKLFFKPDAKAGDAWKPVAGSLQ